MEPKHQKSRFSLLPDSVQQEIKTLLVHDQFTQAKKIYVKWMERLQKKECFN